jgi:RecA-family ATPase
MELQLSFYGKLRLPIAALYASGGRSIHCLVKMDCADAGEYREQVARILKMLAPYGFDAANKNPSRLSRLPGASREIGANENGEQRLLYLNPEPVEGERIFP